MCRQVDSTWASTVAGKLCCHAGSSIWLFCHSQVIVSVTVFPKIFSFGGALCGFEES